MEFASPPDPINISSANVYGNWIDFKAQWECFTLGSGLSEKGEKQQLNAMISRMGVNCIKLYQRFEWPTGKDKEKLKDVQEQFEAYFKGRSSKSSLRQAFKSRKQKSGESIIDFVEDVQSLALTAGYELKDVEITDVITKGVSNRAVKMKLLDLGDEITFEKVLKICRSAQMTQQYLEDEDKLTKTEQPAEADVHKVEGQFTRMSRCGNCGNAAHRGNFMCPAFGKNCNNCGKLNHFASVCKATRGKTNFFPRQQYKPNMRGQGINFNQRRRYQKPVNFVAPEYQNAVPEYEFEDLNRPVNYVRNDFLSNYAEYPTLQNSETDFDEQHIGSTERHVNSLQYQKDVDWTIQVLVQNSLLNLKVDTGAQCNVLSMKTLQSITKSYQPQIYQSPIVLKTFGGNRIKTVGQVNLDVKFRDQHYSILFQVVDTDVPSLLGLKDCQRLELFKQVNTVNSFKSENPEEIVKNYPDLFEGLGCIGNPHIIRTDPTVQPKVHPPRSVPLALRERLKEKLDQMEKQNIIERVTEPTDWVNSIVTVAKKDSIRVCLDPKDLNFAVKREHYPMNTIDNVVSKINDSKVFSVLDANQGFFQIPLAAQSRHLTCFNTPFGRYQYCRLPMGIKSAPEVFQRKMDEIFSKIPGVEIIMDDILIHANNLTQHNKILTEVLETARRNNVTFKPKKTKLGLKQVDYAGHLLTEDGVKVSDSKVKAIKEMSTPKNKEQLRTFLGMMTYLSRYIPNYSERSALLRDLLKEDAEWYWSTAHNKYFEDLKKRITEAPVLKFYSPTKPVTLSVDASKSGLGAVMFQDGRPVAYASKALTAAEQRYAQIEKETLAILFGMEKFKYMLYGRHDVTVETDHKPLESIFKKEIHKSPMRIQKMRLKLQPYEFTVKWRPGKEIPVADNLSRNYLKEYGEVLIDDEEMVCECATEKMPFSTNQRNALKEETAKDITMQTLIEVILHGWPDKKADVPENVRTYWDYREELAVYDGIVFKNDRVVIPQGMRSAMLKIIHQAHLGIVLCKRRAKDVLFWPGMNSEIEDVVSRCEICQRMRSQQQKEPLLPHEVPEGPWIKIASDIFEIDGDYFLITSDYYSEFFEINYLGKHMTSAQVIKCIKEHCSRYGIPETIVTDNGTQYCSNEFRRFCAEYGIKQIFSSPKYPQSNGFAEKTVQTAKRLIIKTKEDKSDLYLALLDLRNTPRDNIIGSPVQRLMNRRTKTQLPTSKQLLLPAVIDPQQVKNQKTQHREMQKFYYDQHVKPLDELRTGDQVQMRTDKSWIPVVIIQHSEYPRSYIVEDPVTGRRYRRNRRDLMRLPGKVKDHKFMYLPRNFGIDVAAPSSSLPVQVQSSPDVPVQSRVASPATIKVQSRVPVPVRDTVLSRSPGALPRVPVRARVPVRTTVPVRTRSPGTLPRVPVRARVPVRTRVPVRSVVDVRTRIPVRATVPVRTRIPVQARVPAQTCVPVQCRVTRTTSGATMQTPAWLKDFVPK
jgi:hypothetical protein